MPLYDYQCEGGHNFEQFSTVASKDETQCNECDQPVRRLVSTFSSKTAEFFTTVGHDGRVIGRRQTTERIPIAVGPTGKEY